jgi:hypothetical protein
VTRAVFLLLLCLIAPAYGQDPGGFNADALASVQTEAIDFVVPRALEPVTAADLATWGLGGLTTIDPALTVTGDDGKIHLSVHGRPTFDLIVRQPDAASWANAVATITAAGRIWIHTRATSRRWRRSMIATGASGTRASA